MTGNGWVGGLVGVNDGTVTGSYATGSVEGEYPVGGLVGRNSGTVEDSYATGCVTGDQRVGGLVGWNNDTVTHSYATGSVTGNGWWVGGLVGVNVGTVMGSYATGSVTGDQRVGGLVGWSNGTVTASYATGSVTGRDNVGGLVGENNSGTVTDSYWNTQLSENAISSGGVGLTTAAMFDKASFAGFDFTGTAASEGNPEVLSVWKLPVLGVSFPHLREVSKNGQVLSIPRIKVILGLGPFSLVPTFFPPTITEAPVFSSDPDTVATIDPSSGEITLGLGAARGDEVTITVRRGGDSIYSSVIGSQVLQVTMAQTVTISEGSTLSKAFGDLPFTLTAIADTTSGLSDFTWVSSNSGVVTVTGGSTATVMLVGVGMTTLTVQEPGDEEWAQGEATVTLTVTKGMQLVSVTPGPSLTRTFGTDTVFDLTATGDAGSGLVSFVWSSGMESVATVSSAGEVTIMGAGVSVITVQEPGNGDWESGEATVTLTVTKGTQTPSGGMPLSKAFGDSEFTLTAVADTTSGLSAFEWVSSDTGVATVPVGPMVTVTVTLVGVGMTTLTAREPGNLNWKEGMTEWMLTVSKGVPQISGFPENREVPLVPATFALGGTSSSGAPITYSVPNANLITISGDMATITGSGIVVVTATVSASANWEGVTRRQTLTVADKMGQTLTFAPLPDKRVGDPPFPLSATSSEPSLTGSITFTSSEESVATVSGFTVTLVGSGMTDIMATQAGSAEFVMASVVQTLTVTKGTQTPSGGMPLSKAFGDLPFTLTAVVDTTSGLSAFEWGSSDTGVATVPGGSMATVTVTLEGVGMTTLTAREPGNEDWEEGMTEWTLEVTQGTQVPLGGMSLTKAFGEEFMLTATADATSGLSAFTWGSSETGVATVPGGTMATVTVTLVGVGMTTLTAREPGNLNWKEGMTEWMLMVLKGTPQISGFPENREVSLVPATFDLGGTSSSGETITYSVPNANVITISGDMGNDYRFGHRGSDGDGVGKCELGGGDAAADPDGGGQNGGRPSRSLLSPDKRVGDSPFPLSATSSESSLTSSITFSSSDESVATVAGFTVTVVGSGMTDITATQAGSAEFVMASVVQTLRVFPSVLTFGSQMILSRNYLQGTLITPLSLPEATGGTEPYTYTLDPVPAGLEF